MKIINNYNKLIEKKVVEDELQNPLPRKLEDDHQHQRRQWIRQPPLMYNSSASISEIQRHVRQANAATIGGGGGHVNNNCNGNGNNKNNNNRITRISYKVQILPS